MVDLTAELPAVPPAASPRGYHVVPRRLIAMVRAATVARRALVLTSERVPALEGGGTGRNGGMFDEIFGLPQIAALLILLQRGLEELYSQHNTRRLLRQGAYEMGGDYYPIVAIAHLGWIASLAFLVPPRTPVHAPLLLAFLALQPLRYWIIGALGRYWTHRIITLPGAPIVTQGPYRFLRHPNYAVTLAETLLLPLAFGQLALGVIFTVIWGGVLHYKIGLEDQALDMRRAAAAVRP